MKRIAIFQCYDKQGVIDDYIPYLLNDLKESLEKLVIVVNGGLTNEGEKKLESLTQYVVCRENKGFDFGAWKYAMTEYLGWEELAAYDELVLLNDTFFGPFYPFRKVFAKMAEREVDFWGLTQHGKVEKDPFGNNPYGCWPRHLQSYFLCIRREMHVSHEFKEYWEKLPLAKSFFDLVGKFETVFTRYFTDRGFRWDSLISNGDTDKFYAYNPYAFNTYEILCQGFPVIKRKEFMAKLGQTLKFNNAEDYRRALEWIKQNTSYDTSLIFQNVLRNYNIADIHDALHLNYIIPDSFLENGNTDTINLSDVLIVLHISYTENIDYYVSFLEKIPEGIDVLITTVSDEKSKIIINSTSPLLGNHLKILVMQNRGRDIAGLLVAARPYIKKYKYMCFCHDKISKHHIYPKGKSFERILWENTLQSKEYIFNVLFKLKSDENLGVLVPPSPMSTNYIRQFFLTNWWGKLNYENTKILLNKLGVNVPISKTKTCLTIGTAFWCKTDALNPLWNYEWKHEDFPEEPMPTDYCLNHAVERSFAYIAQSQGYYTGIAMTPDWASILIDNYKYSFHEIITLHLNINHIARNIGVKYSFKILKRAIHIWLWKITRHYSND